MNGRTTTATTGDAIRSVRRFSRFVGIGEDASRPGTIFAPLKDSTTSMETRPRPRVWSERSEHLLVFGLTGLFVAAIVLMLL